MYVTIERSKRGALLRLNNSIFQLSMSAVVRGSFSESSSFNEGDALFNIIVDPLV